MKSSIDNKSPRQASHLKTKAKKNALMEDRFKQIETENRLLLEKMSNILRVRKNAFLSHHNSLLKFLTSCDFFLASPLPRSIKEERIAKM